MTETDLATAVRAAVDDWMQTQLAQRQAEMANPAALSATLGAAVQRSLVLGGHTPAAARSFVSQAPYRHLQHVFDADELVDTPQAFFPVPDTGATMAARAAVLAVHGLLNLETVSYATENDGSLFVNLVAMPGDGAFAEKSKKGMRGHTDCVSFPLNGEDDAEDVRIAPSPDLVTLVGLRNPKNVPTKLMPLADVLATMAPGDVDELKKPQYSIRSQKTFVQGMKRILGKELVVVDEPVLKDVTNGTYVRYSHSTVVPSEAGGPAEQASNNLEAACNRIAVPVMVQAGDVLIINNRLSLHGRGEVGEDVGGQSRWLLRAYALDTSNLAAHKRHLGGALPHVLFP
ncbi:taurine catabolism dioxygenase TauD, TfdA family protein [Burkholderia pseudomallei TSV 25]|uniref:TauD/TfdA family dioxygenase n=1 Tax=Burkholderia pseudomallei TaxID=28450 RepID=UPI00050F85D5|nr:TauD/TfdA family dioxygenase [Burkholderia pseudomallei]AIV49284.1 taurine catabolism dioxygenase TauD, TfdA family protein [Burkholderia pseudomallei TSV 48]KGC35486.1 taurine catabolism dioxygenase TauD, TfdA family protein [Burkholderia pseudomallei]KGW09996.1 taurine catabolism dioxygenase TauD, TfdA family protein [Burkholderia pseudomallei TSV 25]